ncbi:MAG: anti-sigma factor family protein, partial [Candidatus Rokuibacteriota bacterium]
MTGHEAREWLSAYLDEALAPADRRRIEAHLETCAECRQELAGLRQTVALLRRVEPARAPVGFVDRVVAAARPRPWYRRVVDAVFRPLSIKLPVEITALVMVGLLAVYLFERTPELQQAARPEPPA